MASILGATSSAPSHVSPTVASTAEVPAASSEPTPETLELNDVQNGFANRPAIPLEQDIMQCARLGEIGLLQTMFDSGKLNVLYKDAEGITPLHVRSEKV